MKPAALYFKSAPFDWMCITSVTISHKAITSGVECASSSRKQQKYGSVKPGQLSVNPEKQLLLQQQSWLLLLVQAGSTCLTAASELVQSHFQIPKYPSKPDLCLSLASMSSLSHFSTCQMSNFTFSISCCLCYRSVSRSLSLPTFFSPPPNLINPLCLILLPLCQSAEMYPPSSSLIRILQGSLAHLISSLCKYYLPFFLLHSPTAAAEINVSKVGQITLCLKY